MKRLRSARALLLLTLATSPALAQTQIDADLAAARRYRAAK